MMSLSVFAGTSIRPFRQRARQAHHAGRRRADSVKVNPFPEALPQAHRVERACARGSALHRVLSDKPSPATRRGATGNGPSPSRARASTSTGVPAEQLSRRKSAARARLQAARRLRRRRATRQPTAAPRPFEQFVGHRRGDLQHQLGRSGRQHRRRRRLHVHVGHCITTVIARSRSTSAPKMSRAEIRTSIKAGRPTATARPGARESKTSVTVSVKKSPSSSRTASRPCQQAGAPSHEQRPVGRRRSAAPTSLPPRPSTTAAIQHSIGRRGRIGAAVADASCPSIRHPRYR